jgi:hypothetical protein
MRPTATAAGFLPPLVAAAITVANQHLVRGAKDGCDTPTQ